MIRNIVFDMGMVLLEYDPVKVCWEYTDNPEDVEWMRRELFDSKEWSLLDEGTLTDAQALERVQKRLPNEHLRWLAKESLEHWHEYNIWAKPGMGDGSSPGGQRRVPQGCNPAGEGTERKGLRHLPLLELFRAPACVRV